MTFDELIEDIKARGYKVRDAVNHTFSWGISDPKEYLKCTVVDTTRVPQDNINNKERFDQERYMIAARKGFKECPIYVVVENRIEGTNEGEWNYEVEPEDISEAPLMWESSYTKLQQMIIRRIIKDYNEDISGTGVEYRLSGEKVLAWKYDKPYTVEVVAKKFINSEQSYQDVVLCISINDANILGVSDSQYTSDKGLIQDKNTPRNQIYDLGFIKEKMV